MSICLSVCPSVSWLVHHTLLFLHFLSSLKVEKFRYKYFMDVYAPVQIISAPAQLITTPAHLNTAPAQPPATGLSCIRPCFTQKIIFPYSCLIWNFLSVGYFLWHRARHPVWSGHKFSGEQVSKYNLANVSAHSRVCEFLLLSLRVCEYRVANSRVPSCEHDSVVMGKCFSPHSWHSSMTKFFSCLSCSHILCFALPYLLLYHVDAFYNKAWLHNYFFRSNVTVEWRFFISILRCSPVSL